MKTELEPVHFGQISHGVEGHIHGWDVTQGERSNDCNGSPCVQTNVKKGEPLTPREHHTPRDRYQEEEILTCSGRLGALQIMLHTIIYFQWIVPTAYLPFISPYLQHEMPLVMWERHKAALPSSSEGPSSVSSFAEDSSARGAFRFVSLHALGNDRPCMSSLCVLLNGVSLLAACACNRILR